MKEAKLENAWIAKLINASKMGNWQENFEDSPARLYT